MYPGNGGGVLPGRLAPPLTVNPVSTGSTVRMPRTGDESRANGGGGGSIDFDARTGLYLIRRAARLMFFGAGI